jgi:DNA primase (bacterial type)
MEKEELDFKGALEWFARNFGIDVTRNLQAPSRRPTILRSKKAIVFQKTPQQSEFYPDSEVYEWLIEKCGKVSDIIGISYLESHGISEEAALRFKVRELRDPARAFELLVKTWGKDRIYRCGLAWGASSHPQCLIWNSYALLFPCYEGDVIACIQARMFQCHPKFLNPRGVPKPMFNVNGLQSLRQAETLCICEGIPDAIALESNGIAAVGIMGATSFRAEWVDRLMRFNIVLLGDGDTAGTQFVKTISDAFIGRGKAVQCLSLPKGKDVADTLAEIRSSL